MANRWAVASGNYNTAATWNDPGGGATVPNSGDDVYSNNYTVQLDIDVTANTLRNTANAGLGIAADGSFAYSGAANRSITATNGFYGRNAGVLNINIGAGYTVTIVGNCITSTTGRWFTFAGAGIINYTGGINASWTGGYNGGGIYSSNTGTVSIVGDLNPGSYFAAGVQYNNWAFYNAGVGTVNISGNIYGNGNGYSVVNASTGRINIAGTVKSGASASGYGVYSTTAGIVQLIGIADTQTPPTTVCPAIYITTGTLYLGGLVYNRSTTLAVSAPKMALLAAHPTSWQFVDEGVGTKSLYSTDTTMFGYPAESDTRSGTVFGQTSEFTGSCKVPTAAQVLLGVPIDATTGTALMTPADFWDYAKASATTVGSMGEMCVNIDKKTGLIPALL